ncbi:MAG: hypothetical protein FJZ79_03405 [Chlorobi bacterium]|nr:hypothetical protein [Chlorobiota bacterium]
MSIIFNCSGSTLTHPAGLPEIRPATFGFGFGLIPEAVVDEATATFGFGLGLLTAGVAGSVDGVMITSSIQG